MKPLYVVLIAIAVIVIFVVVYQFNKTKQLESQAATANALNSGYPSGILTQGGSSQVSSIINSLFPYFQTAAQTGIIGDGQNKSSTTPQTTVDRTRQTA